MAKRRRKRSSILTTILQIVGGAVVGHMATKGYDWVVNKRAPPEKEPERNGPGMPMPVALPVMPQQTYMPLVTMANPYQPPMFNPVEFAWARQQMIPTVAPRRQRVQPIITGLEDDEDDEDDEDG